MAVWFAWQAGYRPGSRVTFFCFAKRKSPKKRRAKDRAPAGYPALLALGGVWRKLASLKQAPALIRPTLRCSARPNGGKSGERIPRARALARTLHAVWSVSRVAALALGWCADSGCFREFAMPKASERIWYWYWIWLFACPAVEPGLSSAAAGGSGGRMFEAKPSLRPTRPLRAAQGTAQRPWRRLAFSLLTLFWRSKRK